MSRRYLCGTDAETTSHFFLCCIVTDQSWKIFISLGGISWTMPLRLLTLFQLRGSWNSCKKQRYRDDYPSIYLVDHLERKKCQMFFFFKIATLYSSSNKDMLKIVAAMCRRSSLTVYCYFVSGVQRLNMKILKQPQNLEFVQYAISV